MLDALPTRPRTVARRVPCAALCAGLMLVSRPASLAAQPGPAYLDLVNRYADGQRALAIAALGAWTEGDLEAELAGLRAWARSAKPGSAAQQSAFLQLPLRAVVMLHTDAWEDLSLPVSERLLPECGRGAHAAVAEYAVGLLSGHPATVQAPAPDFARRWYLAMALRSLGEHCLQDALDWAEAGLKRFPRDPELLLALGTAQEAAGSLPAPVPDLGRRDRQRVRSNTSERRYFWDRARRSFEEALTADVELDEARLRLGNVQWSLQQGEAARASLQAVLARSAALARQQEPSLLYLAHLFLGRIHEDAKRLGEAEREYREALALEPRAQVAAVALSHVLYLAGGQPDARQVLASALALAPRRNYEEAYWMYSRGRADSAPELLRELRRESLR